MFEIHNSYKLRHYLLAACSSVHLLPIRFLTLPASFNEKSPGPVWRHSLQNLMGCGEPPYPYSAPSVRNARVLSIRGAVYGVTDYYGAHTARRGPLCPEHNALDLSRARIDVSPSIPLLFPGANRSFSVPSSLSPLFSFRSLLSSRKVPWRNGAIVNLTLRPAN